MEPVTCTIADAVKATGISRTKLYSLIGAGEIETVKLSPRRTLVKCASIRRLVGVPDQRSGQAR